MGTGLILVAIGLVIIYMTRFLVWFTWNMELVSTRRGKTIIKLIGLIIGLLFVCPGFTILLLDVLSKPLVRFPN